MKELTIEEKAKRYDEAIETARKINIGEGVAAPPDWTVLEVVFPELKESKDERIKKCIIDTLKGYHHLISTGGITKEDMIAWLEKQDKCKIDYPQNHQDSNCPNGCIVLEDFNGGEGFYKVHLDYLNKKQVEEIEEMIRVWNKDLKTSNENIKDCIGMCLTDVNEQRFKDYGTNLRDCLAWLEKQGEQPKKNDVCDNCDQQGSCVSPCPMKLVEKQGEQKSAEKVEPKFKVGKWYQCTKDFFGKGVTFDKNTAYYCAKEGCLQNEYGCHIAIDKKLYDHFKLWTIQDTKDGDVLSYATDEEDLWIMIYWSLYEPYEGHVHYHALLVNNNFSDKGTCCICIDDLKPATNKQRYLLFQKMKESGYEWDAEKKELKKIEKKPTDSKIIDLDELVIELEETIGTSPHSRETIKYFFQKAVQKYMKCLQIANGEIGRLMDENYHLKEQKPAWSAEDEKHYRSLLCLFECVSPKEEDTCWFKTIKNRVQPKQEWSEEDIVAIDCAVDVLSRDLPSLAASIKRLKSLRPQNRWKPSIAQLNALSIVSKGNISDDIEAIVSLYNDLKKLREE